MPVDLRSRAPTVRLLSGDLARIVQEELAVNRLDEFASDVAEIRACLKHLAQDPAHLFPRLVGHLGVRCEHILTRALRLIRVHVNGIVAGHAPRISAACCDLRSAARASAAHGLSVCRDPRHIPNKGRVDKFNARQQARWLGWLITRATRAGRAFRGQDNDLVVDVLGLIRELVEDMPWEHLTKPSLQQRVGLVRRFGEEVQQITGPPGSLGGAANGQTLGNGAPSASNTPAVVPGGIGKVADDA